MKKEVVSKSKRHSIFDFSIYLLSFEEKMGPGKKRVSDNNLKQLVPYGENKSVS